MTKRSSTPADAVLVAIDMSKHRQEVLIERPEGGRRRRMTIMATKADYDRLATELGSIGRPIVVGFEATGNYHRTLAQRERDLLARELRLLHAKPPALLSFDFAGFLSFSLEAFSGQGQSTFSRAGSAKLHERGIDAAGISAG